MALVPALLALAVSLSDASFPVVPGGEWVPLGSAPAPATALAAEGFVLVAEDKGVKVYRREKRAGLEFAAEGTFAASPERVRRVLLDYGNHQRWQKQLRDSRVLARGDGFIDVYQRMGLPVIDDRDYTLHVTWGEEGSVLWTRFVTANDRGPAPVSGVVRVVNHEGGFRLEPIDGGKATRVVYRFYIDMAGSFPLWAARGQAASDIPAFFLNAGKQLAGAR